MKQAGPFGVRPVFCASGYPRTGTDTEREPVGYGYADGCSDGCSATVYGPVSSTTVYACVPAVSGGSWTFTATSTTSGALGCVLGFGGRIVARDSAYNKGALVPETVDCTGNPGR